ncbi:transcriptional regulator [Vibrio sp. 10N.237.312.C02]
MNANSPDKITLDASGIELNNNTLINSSSNKQVTLSSSESLILEHLVMNSPKAIGRDFLLEHCWPGRVVTGSSLNVAIKNIRTALNELNCECKILTVQKQGYSFSRPQQLGGYLSTPISAIQTQVAQVNVPNETVELEVFNTDSDRSDDSKSESVLPQQRELHKQRRVKSFLTRHQSRIAGIVVSALLLMLFYQFAFFIDKSAYRGMDVYHDSLNFDEAVIKELDAVSELGVDSLYLHRIGVGCQNIQAVALINGHWKEISHQFKTVSCEGDNDNERGQ